MGHKMDEWSWCISLYLQYQHIGSEVGIAEDQGHPSLHVEFETIFGHRRTCPKTVNTTKVRQKPGRITIKSYSYLLAFEAA